MDNNMPACMNSRCLDLLYNHKAICEALVKSGGKRRLGDPLQARQRPAAALRLREYLRAALHFSELPEPEPVQFHPFHLGHLPRAVLL